MNDKEKLLTKSQKVIIDRMAGEVAKRTVETLFAVTRMTSKSTDPAIFWLLEFIQLDLVEISEGDWLNLKSEVDAFQVIGAGFDGNVKQNEPEIYPHFVFLTQDKPSVVHDDIIWFQVHAKHNISKVLKGEGFVIEFSDLFFSLSPSKNPANPWEFELTGKGMRHMIMYHLAHVLQKYAHRIRRCPECEKIFLSDRKNQSYCSLKHQNKSAVKKYRESRGLITGRPRGRPPKGEIPVEGKTLKKRGVKHGKKRKD